jgi:branched-chain amino acid transport system substrate-binding protein
MHDVGIATPDTAVASAWDPTLIIVSGLRQLGPNATATQLRDYILKLHDFAGLNGMYDFRRGDQHGLDPLSSPLVRWDKTAGAFVLISKPGGMPLSP